MVLLQGGRRTMVQNARLVLVCISIAANALCAGGVYSFPLISPGLLNHLKLTQPQLTTIALAGMVGQYPFAAFVGTLLDRYGPRSCSLLASIFFFLGFGLFSWEVSMTQAQGSEPNASYLRLAFYFGMASFATVLSYFSLVFSATRSFPLFMGIASGTSMALFGFSPVILSVIAAWFQTGDYGEIEVAPFVRFLAILAGSVNLFGALVMPGAESNVLAQPKSLELLEDTGSYESPEEDDSDLEDQPLLLHSDASSNDPRIHHVAVQEPHNGSVADLIKDSNFWVLMVTLTILMGASEMVMTNLGSIYLSLPSSASSPANISVAVQALFASNTITRLLVGPFADYVSPVPSYLPGKIWSFPRKQHCSRVVFLVGACVLLAMTFSWLEVGVKSKESLWTLSVGTGIVYGLSFTIVPGILSSIWGLPNLGRNFGIVSYAPFVGTTAFSYLYAFVSARQTTPEQTTCEGVQCWTATFWLCTALAVVAASLASILWRRWRGRV